MRIDCFPLDRPKKLGVRTDLSHRSVLPRPVISYRRYPRGRFMLTPIAAIRGPFDMRCSSKRVGAGRRHWSSANRRQRSPGSRSLRRLFPDRFVIAAPTRSRDAEHPRLEQCERTEGYRVSNNGRFLLAAAAKLESEGETYGMPQFMFHVHRHITYVPAKFLDETSTKAATLPDHQAAHPSCRMHGLTSRQPRSHRAYLRH